jgi:hypothetical protein
VAVWRLVWRRDGSTCVASKEELKDRIMAAMDFFNQKPWSTFGYDEAARAAAVALGSDRRYDTDRLRTKAELIPALAGLEDSPWGEWIGLDAQGDTGRLLRPCAIRSKTLRPPGRRPGTKSESGYVSNSRPLGLLL